MKNQAEVKFVALFCRDGNKVPRTEQQESEYIKAGVNCAGGFQFRAINADDVPAITGVEYQSACQVLLSRRRQADCHHC